ncbi:type II secretion system protein [Dechloromonas denitrificans]|uniref:type II secretion system protein n=1 Tax=Dechloromonas denitrificans TaxID=281362 RepID=UPI001CF7F598|nr:type II secretion system protein [Dechloromonas denitrificans]UCV04960.1 type II secretion system protein [Dechloromonas denitrificans]
MPRGFTLVEISIVLVIMALVLGAGMSLLMAQVDSQRQAATRVKEETIRSALTNFISRNSRLPCPADPTLAAGDANFGVEAATPGTCTGIISTGAAPAVVVTGLVPWVSLGLAAETAADGFFNQFSYQVVASATNLNLRTIPGMRGYISLHSSGPGVLGQAPAGNQINDCSNGLAFNPCAAVAVIVSHGKNGFGAFLAGGARSSTAGTGADERANADNDSQYVRKDFSEIAGNRFDDVLLALTPNDLLAPLTQNGSLKDSRAAIIATTEQMKGAIIANAVSLRSGAAGAMQYPLPNALWFATNLTAPDPWGAAFEYTPVTSPISATTLPGAIAFTILSRGADNATPTTDDTLVAVTAGELQAAFAKVGL